MDAKNYQSIDLVIKVVSLVAVVAGLGWGAVQYFDSKRQGYYMQLWNKKLDYYIQVSTAVARISTSDSAAEVEKDIESFWSLYYGPMALLEDNNVKDSMKKIGGFVTEFEGKSKESDAKTRKPPQLSNTDPEFMKTFRDASYNLAKEMQISLEQSRTQPFSIGDSPVER